MRTVKSRATLRREQNMIRIHLLLQRGKVELVQIQDLIGGSQSGVRKLLQELKRANIIDMIYGYDKEKGNNKAVYVLREPMEILIKYLKTDLDSHMPDVPHFLVTPTEHGSMHILTDDAPYRTRKPESAVPQHTQIMKFFYGMNDAPVS